MARSPITCERCDYVIDRPTRTQKYCSVCGDKVAKEQSRAAVYRWRQKNPRRRFRVILKSCERCLTLVETLSETRRYCVDCRPIVQRSNVKSKSAEWIKNNPNKLAIYRRRATLEKNGGYINVGLIRRYPPDQSGVFVDGRRYGESSTKI